jgi:multicomponent Na+:H+ antiporter subunit E
VRVLLLTALWLLAWGEVSAANVVSGLMVAAALLLALPESATPSTRVQVHPLAAARLVGYVGVQLVTSNIAMIGQILRRRPTTRPGVLAHHLDQPSEHLVTVMTSVIALSPGTMTVDVDPTSSTIYVHFLFLEDPELARAGLVRLERLASRAIGSDRQAEQAGAP